MVEARWNEKDRCVNIEILKVLLQRVQTETWDPVRRDSVPNILSLPAASEEIRFTILILLACAVASHAMSWPDSRDPALLANVHHFPVGAAVKFSVSRTLGDNMVSSCDNKTQWAYSTHYENDLFHQSPVSQVLQRAPASAIVWGFVTAGVTIKTSFQGKVHNFTLPLCLFI